MHKVIESLCIAMRVCVQRFFTSSTSSCCSWCISFFFSVLHHCVVIFFWSSGINDCMFVYIWKRSSAHALGASVVWHFSLPLMKSFNKTEAAVFLFRPCSWGLPFLQFSIRVYYVLSRVSHYCHVVAMLQGAGAATQPRQGQEQGLSHRRPSRSPLLLLHHGLTTSASRLPVRCFQQIIKI